MKGTDLREMRESLGPRGFHRTVVDLLNDEKVAPADFSLKELWEACVGPVSRTLSSAMRATRGLAGAELAVEALTGQHAEAVGTTLFQIVTGELIARKVIEGYETTEGFIGDQLVTLMPSKVRNERVAGFTALEGPGEVPEGEPYDESTWQDKYVTTVESKKGRILSITEEAVLFDQTGQMLLRAGRLGEATRQERERVIVRGVIDADYNATAGTGVFRPSGTLEALYPTDGSNYNYVGVGNTTSASYNAAVALADWTDVDTVMTYHAQEVTDDRAGTGRPIVWMPKILLTSVGDSQVGRRIVNATEVRTTTTGAAASDTQALQANPLLGAFKPLTSPFVDEVDANDWFLGDFQKQFVWKEIWPLQTFRQGRDSDAAFDSDVVARFKVRYYGGINALDTVWVVKVDGA